MFALDHRLEHETFFVADLELSRVILMNNALFPWLILVPRVEKAVELIDLSDMDQHLLMDEISFASVVVRNVFNPHKINVAALGNQTKQLHVHIIARFTTDSAWPEPVWGKGSQPYDDPKPLVEKLHWSFKS
ncbi:MAG TPA: HIT family protein [Rickettsiales bacterium]|nr:HIT family protein [Rickettsiales bacterium]